MQDKSFEPLTLSSFTRFCVESSGKMTPQVRVEENSEYFSVLYNIFLPQHKKFHSNIDLFKILSFSNRMLFKHKMTFDHLSNQTNEN